MSLMLNYPRSPKHHFFVWIHLLLLYYFCVCLSVPFTRRSHHLASIHHTPPTSHPSRSYCSVKHPRLRPHSHWQQRYSNTPHTTTNPSACYFIFHFSTLHLHLLFFLFKLLPLSFDMFNLLEFKISCELLGFFSSMVIQEHKIHQVHRLSIWYFKLWCASGPWSIKTTAI